MSKQSKIKYFFDKDLKKIKPILKAELAKEKIQPCQCGCYEVYVALINKKTIDVKCYDCGTSFFEFEIEEQ